MKGEAMTDSTDIGVEQDAPASQDANAPRASKRNKFMIPGVTLGVIVVLGAAFFVWHNTPGFCNAICHAPMDTYVETYNDPAPGMGVAAHAAAGKSCLDCHEAELTQQVTEVMSFVSDDFATDAHGYLVPENVKADGDFCLRSGCHDWNDVVASTAGFEGNDAKYNPHASHQDGVLECSDCHKMHRQSALECNECHALNAPEGWGK